MINRKLISVCLVTLLGIGLAGCTKNDSSLEKENSSLRAENNKLSSKSTSSKESIESNVVQSSDSEDSTINKTYDSSENSTQSPNNNPIQSAQDAENLVEHSMHTDPGVYHAVPTAGGFIVSRDDIPGSAFVQNNGNITWNDGSSTSYSEASAPTTN